MLESAPGATGSAGSAEYSAADVATLEWANYAATLPAAQVTPALELTMQDEVIITASQAFPFPDANHACRLRASQQRAEELIDEVSAYFAERGLPATVFVSPACAPADIGDRLLAHGYARHETLEAWLVLHRLPAAVIPTTSAGIEVRRLGHGEALAFAQVFLEAFEMPVDFASYLAQMLEPTFSLSGTAHYLAKMDGRAAGVLSLLCHDQFGILGSAGVVPGFRRRGAIYALVAAAALEAQQRGIEMLMLQTTAGTPLERLLRISGFRRAFTRACYVRPWTH